MLRNHVCLLILILTSCGSQKELYGIADQVVKDYLKPMNIVIINAPSNQEFLKATNEKYEYYKDYNPSPLNPSIGDTLKHIFSEKNMTSFKTQLRKQMTWAEKPYVKQTIINREDESKYNDRVIFTLSYPVISSDKKFALMQSSSFNKRYMVGSDELLIFRKQKNKWVIYKRFELSIL